jgi:hypothetical protein
VIRLAKIISCIAIVAASGPWGADARADVVFDYAGNSPVSLGRSIDIRLPTVTKNDCLDSIAWQWDESEPAKEGTPGGVQRVSVNAEYIDDYRDLFEQLHFNASFKGSATIKEAITVGAEANIDYGTEFTGKYSDLSYIVMAQYEFGRRRLKTATLKKEYLDLIHEGKYTDFIEACGTHFAISEDRWADAAIIVNIDKLDESMKRRIEFTYKSKADVVKIGSGEMALDAEKEIKSIHRYGSQHLKFDAHGGDSTKLDKLASATNANDLKSSLAAMEAYMTGIARDTSAIKSYRMASFEMFGLQIPTGPDVTSFMGAVYFSEFRYQQMIQAVRAGLDDAERFAAATTALREIYQRDLYTLTQQKAALDSLAVACVKKGVCDINAIRKAAPRISYTTSLLVQPSLEANCIYAGDAPGDALTEVGVRLFGRFVDPMAVQDFRVYRIPEYQNGKPQEAHVKRTGLAEDPTSNRFVASVEHLRDDPASPLTLPEEARALRYEMAVTVFDGSTEWYDLGYLTVPADRCPLVRH